MFSFKGYSSSGANTHLEHLEDSIINDGAKGGRNAIAFLKSLRHKESRKHRWSIYDIIYT